ncbi:MAG TPA: hypothetical protein VG898_07505, partial [Solirubrobacterales bacterium]|nr:hypothetical protein [Solirubrobacterales bacterium]
MIRAQKEFNWRAESERESVSVTEDIKVSFIPNGLLAVLGCMLLVGAMLIAVVPAQAAYDLTEFDVTFTNAKGEAVDQAGAHPNAIKVTLGFPAVPSGKGGEEIEEAPKDLILTQIPGFVGNPFAVPPCSTADFLTTGSSVVGEAVSNCPDASAVGTISVRGGGAEITGFIHGAVYNLAPPPGVAAKLGFWIKLVPVTIELGVKESPPYNIVGGSVNISQQIEVIGATFTLWGNPGAKSHDSLRGRCINPSTGASDGECPANISPIPFLTLPRSCEGPLKTFYKTDSWKEAGIFSEGFAETHDDFGQSSGFEGCGKLGFSPNITAQPTSRAAASPTGLDFSLDTDNEGLANPDGVSNADVEKAVVTLPEGFSVNPALAEGLATCSETQFQASSPYLAPGEGPNFAPPGVSCPEAATIGSVEVETPILENTLLKGKIFAATPYENSFDSLLAIYMVIREPKLGIVVKVPLKVEPDPNTGQLTTTGEDLPPFPFSHFRLHFREGARSPLTSPSSCGAHAVSAVLYPWSGTEPVTSTSTFQIISGPDNSPCPTGGLPPFHPDL